MGQTRSRGHEQPATEENPQPNAPLQVQTHPITHDYEIKKKLGQGCFAEVRLCRKRETDEEFAVKIISKKRLQKPAKWPGEPAKSQQDSKQAKALKREIEILKSVDHPHCVHLEAIYQSANHLHLVLELCAGGELFEMICEYNHFTEAQASNVVSQVADALSYLHNLGIVHRDVKPENILLDEKHPDSPVKLTDFGLANKLDGKDLKFWTSCGTLYYAAPEVFSSNSYSEKIDFWSLGVVMYVLLVGYLPFQHDKRDKTIQLIRRGRVSFDMEDWGSISREARDLIRNLCQKDPGRRYNSEQIFNHPWIRGSSGTAEVNTEKIRTFQEQRKVEFQNAISIRVRLQRWKQAAEQLQREESIEDEEYEGVGMTPQAIVEKNMEPQLLEDPMCGKCNRDRLISIADQNHLASYDSGYARGFTCGVCKCAYLIDAFDVYPVLHCPSCNYDECRRCSDRSEQKQRNDDEYDQLFDEPVESSVSEFDEPGRIQATEITNGEGLVQQERFPVERWVDDDVLTPGFDPVVFVNAEEGSPTTSREVYNTFENDCVEKLITVTIEDTTFYRWGVGAHLPQEDPSAWHVTEVDPSLQFGQKGIKAGWKIKAVNELNPIDYPKEVETFLTDGAACTITFSTEVPIVAEVASVPEDILGGEIPESEELNHSLGR